MPEIENKVDAKALSDNTANLGLANIGDVTLNFDGKGAANAIGAVAIALNPGKLADMREASTDGLIRSAKKYRDELGMTKEQALLMAMGTPSTPGQAFKIFDILDKAQHILDERGTEALEPSETKAAKMLEGAKNSEDWAKAKWAHLIAGELEAPGTFSKQTVAILDNMGQEDAELFEKFCSVCTGGHSDFMEADYEVLPYRTEDGVFGGSDLTNDDMIRLSALGLVDTDHFKNADVTESAGYSLVINGEYFIVTTAKKSGELKRGSCLLTPFGQELAKLCDLGSHPGFLEFVRADVERQGLKLESAEAIIRASGYDTFREKKEAPSRPIDAVIADAPTASSIDDRFSFTSDADIAALFDGKVPHWEEHDSGWSLEIP